MDICRYFFFHSLPYNYLLFQLNFTLKINFLLIKPFLFIKPFNIIKKFKIIYFFFFLKYLKFVEFSTDHSPVTSPADVTPKHIKSSTKGNISKNKIIMAFTCLLISNIQVQRNYFSIFKKNIHILLYIFAVTHRTIPSTRFRKKRKSAIFPLRARAFIGSLSWLPENSSPRLSHQLRRQSTRPLKSISEEHSCRNRLPPKNIFLRTPKSKLHFSEFEWLRIFIWRNKMREEELFRRLFIKGWAIRRPKIYIDIWEALKILQLFILVLSSFIKTFILTICLCIKI